jgi:hypothetical protein
MWTRDWWGNVVDENGGSAVWFDDSERQLER